MAATPFPPAHVQAFYESVAKVQHAAFEAYWKATSQKLMAQLATNPGYTTKLIWTGPDLESPGPAAPDHGAQVAALFLGA